MNKAEFRKYYRLRRAFYTLNYEVLDETFPDWANGEIMDFFYQHYPAANRVFYNSLLGVNHDRRSRFKPTYIEQWQVYFREFKRLKYCESIGLKTRSNLYCMISVVNAHYSNI